MMQKKRYEIDDRKPSVLPKIGTAVIALGSLASAAAVAAPQFSDLAPIAASSSPTQTSQLENSTPRATLPSKKLNETAPTGSTETQTANLANPNNLALPAPDSGAKELVAAANQPAAEAIAAPAPASEPPALEPIGGTTVGNVSSSTPTAGAPESWNQGTANTPVGNASSATPGGHDDDDEDDDDHGWLEGLFGDDDDDHDDDDHDDRDDHDDDDDD